MLGDPWGGRVFSHVGVSVFFTKTTSAYAGHETQQKTLQCTHFDFCILTYFRTLFHAKRSHADTILTAYFDHFQNV